MQAVCVYEKKKENISKSEKQKLKEKKTEKKCNCFKGRLWINLKENIGRKKT